MPPPDHSPSEEYKQRQQVREQHVAHREAAARLFALVRIGTPGHIAQSFPEDAKYAKDVMRIDQSHDPDPPRSLLMSSAWFTAVPR